MESVKIRSTRRVNDILDDIKSLREIRSIKTVTLEKHNFDHLLNNLIPPPFSPITSSDLKSRYKDGIPYDGITIKPASK